MKKNVLLTKVLPVVSIFLFVGVILLGIYAVRLTVKTGDISRICVEVDALIQDIYDAYGEKNELYDSRINADNATYLSGYRLPKDIYLDSEPIPEGFVDQTKRSIEKATLNGTGLTICYTMSYGIVSPRIPLLENETMIITIDSISDNWYITDVSGTFLEP